MMIALVVVGWWLLVVGGWRLAVGGWRLAGEMMARWVSTTNHQRPTINGLSYTVT
jgi:hypothetical protein